VLDLRFSQWWLKCTVFWIVRLYNLGKDGDDLFLRKVRVCPNYTALKPRRQHFFLLYLLKFSYNVEIIVAEAAEL
jgi:hypothetical protein